MSSSAGGPTRGDLVLAVTLTVVGQVEIWWPHLVPGVGEVTGSRPLLAVTTLLVTSPVLVRRRWPLAAFVVGIGAAGVQALLTTPTESLAPLVALLVLAYAAGAYAARREAILAGGVLVVGSALLGSDVADRVFVAMLLTAAWIPGFVVGRRTEQVLALADDNRALADRLAEAADRLVEAERAAAASAGPRADELGVLSPRELEVTRAIAGGMSNREIAAELVISEWTVKTHVASILRKLGLRDRAQVVAAAYEAGLVHPSAPRTPPADGGVGD